MKNLIKENSHHEGHEVHEVRRKPNFIVPVFRNSFVVFVTFVVGAAFAGPSDKPLTVEEISQKVDEAQTKVTDAQMSLEMEMKDALSGAQQKMKGSVKMKSPDRIYVHYTQPEEQFLYIEGKLAQMYQPSQKTVYRQETAAGKNEAPIYLGLGKQLKKYMGTSHVSILKNSGDEVALLLVPKDKMAAGFDKMTVTLRKKDWWPVRMEMETPSMTTKVRFSNFAFNQALSVELFKFTPPKGAQVVDGSIF